VFVVAGAAGTGKTTLGRALAQACGAALLDLDAMTNPLLGQICLLAGIPLDFDHPALRDPIRHARYRCVLDTALENIAVGRPVVLVAPFTTEISDRGAWDDAFADFEPTALNLIWVAVPLDLARERRRSRGQPQDLAANLDGASAPVTRPVVPHLAVDGAATTMQEVSRILRHPARTIQT
jgi:predicted kinase